MVPCPLCGRPLHPAVLKLNTPLEPYVARRLRERTPRWVPDEGACPRCILDAVRSARNARRTESLHHELLLPYPVFGYDETQLLPTPYRMRAYPQFSGRGVTLAILDSGFYPHPDLTQPYNRILAYVDATTRQPVERDNFKRPALTSWHGLMTASVAAGNGALSEGVFRGIASGANLVLVKTGNRRGRRIHESDIYRALQWVILNQHRYNIRVVNISLGGDHSGSGALGPLDELVEEAAARGMSVVAAVGNAASQIIAPPASAPSAITVGGLDDQNSLEPARRRMYHSNFGRGVYDRIKPELIAPARWLAAPMLPQTWVHNEAQYLWRLVNLSDAELERALRTRTASLRFKKETLALPLEEVRRVIRRRMIEQKYIHAHYQHVDGTSMAAPIVTSIIAQMLEANPTLTPERIKEILIETAEPLADYPSEQQGAGVVNAPRAVAFALRAPGGPMQGVPLSPRLTAAEVAFHYYDAMARRVHLVADWNGWLPDNPSMDECAPGVWSLRIPRPAPGVYAYKFLVEHPPHLRLWQGDPENSDRIEDGSGGFYSLLEVR